MTKATFLLRIIWAALVLCQPAFAKPTAALDASLCRAVSADTPLPTDWEKYRAAVRACPLAHGRHAARVQLWSVFVDDYYQALAASAPWETFPRARLVDAQGRCLAQVGHLFPVEPPRELIVRPGKWKEGLPTEIRFHVKNPAVSGNYDLPTLHWNPQSGRYQAPTNSQPAEKEQTLCP